MFPAKYSGQGIVVCLNNHAVSNPLPELRLGGPELLAITADYQGGLFLSLLLVSFSIHP